MIMVWSPPRQSFSWTTEQSHNKYENVRNPDHNAQIPKNKYKCKRLMPHVNIQDRVFCLISKALSGTDCTRYRHSFVLPWTRGCNSCRHQGCQAGRQYMQEEHSIHFYHIQRSIPDGGQMFSYTGSLLCIGLFRRIYLKCFQSVASRLLEE